MSPEFKVLNYINCVTHLERALCFIMIAEERSHVKFDRTLPSYITCCCWWLTDLELLFHQSCERCLTDNGSSASALLSILWVKQIDIWSASVLRQNPEPFFLTINFLFHYLSPLFVRCPTFLLISFQIQSCFIKLASLLLRKVLKIIRIHSSILGLASITRIRVAFRNVIITWTPSWKCGRSLGISTTSLG